MDMDPRGIEPPLLKIGFVVAGGEFYSYYELQRIKLNTERKNLRSKISFMHSKNI